MKTLSIIFYILGSALLIVSCFATSITLVWWFGALAVVTLICGCIFQYKANDHTCHKYVVVRQDMMSDRQKDDRDSNPVDHSI